MVVYVQNIKEQDISNTLKQEMTKSIQRYIALRLGRPQDETLSIEMKVGVLSVKKFLLF